MHLSVPLAPRNLVPQVGQRDVAAEALDQRGLAILVFSPATLAGQAHHVAGIVAEGSIAMPNVRFRK